MSRIIHFEVHADNPERALTFYQSLLGWKFTRWEGPSDYWLIETGPGTEPGINGGMVRRMGPPPTEGQAVNAYPCTLGVSSLDEKVAMVTQLGGTIALPKMAVPGIGWLAYAKDTEGNIFGMMQDDSAAR
ncbi:MAG: VOC family protein [Gemmatimonadota bacterium]